MFQKKSLSFTILKLAVLPVLLLGVATTVFVGYFTNHIMEKDIEKNLSNMTYAIRMQFNSVNSDEYTYQDNVLKKGQVVLNEDFSNIDELKEKSGVDITVFYGAERILTTIMDETGERVLYTMAPEEVQEKVLNQGEEFFTNNIQIQEIPYFGYYIPLHNTDGAVIGMIFAGESRKKVQSTVEGYIVKVVASIFLFVVLMVLAAFGASRNIIDFLKEVKIFLGKVAQGELEAVPSKKISSRTDEIGELGSYIVKVRDSLKDMIERDPLTLLYNRRYCDRQLSKIAEQALEGETEDYTIVIGDIDFFKKINDMYGHSCGDYVLKELSADMEKLVRGKGFVARWGGEEFLMVFRNMTQQQVYRELTRFLQKIREKRFYYQDKTFSLTMTFGVQQLMKNQTPEEVIHKADEKLYAGKENGRNVIVA